MLRNTSFLLQAPLWLSFEGNQRVGELASRICTRMCSSFQGVWEWKAGEKGRCIVWKWGLRNCPVFKLRARLGENWWPSILRRRIRGAMMMMIRRWMREPRGLFRGFMRTWENRGGIVPICSCWKCESGFPIWNCSSILCFFGFFFFVFETLLHIIFNCGEICWERA